MEQEKDQQSSQSKRSEDPGTQQKATVTHNLDTGKDEPLGHSLNDESIMDFGSGSGGGSAGDGAAS